jgi:hypothetical protein
MAGIFVDMRKCSCCKKTCDQGDWPDGPRWCSATVEIGEAIATWDVCPHCCLCGGQRECSVANVLAVVLPGQPTVQDNVAGVLKKIA